MAFNPLEDSEDAKAERSPAAEISDLPVLPAPVDSYDAALQKGHAYMKVANDSFKKAGEIHLRLEAVAVDLARANFLQTRALAYYQFAALIKES